jgi:predicted Fe-Mo cluster-binding NifX family protein
MKIALTVKGVGLGAWLDDHYAQCGFVLLVDDDNQFESWKNPIANTEGQSPQELTTLIIEVKPDVLVTGKITEPQKETLTSEGIRVMDNCQGFVLELLDQARE